MPISHWVLRRGVMRHSVWHLCGCMYSTMLCRCFKYCRQITGGKTNKLTHVKAFRLITTQGGKSRTVNQEDLQRLNKETQRNTAKPRSDKTPTVITSCHRLITFKIEHVLSYSVHERWILHTWFGFGLAWHGTNFFHSSHALSVSWPVAKPRLCLVTVAMLSVLIWHTQCAVSNDNSGRYFLNNGSLIWGRQ